MAEAFYELQKEGILKKVLYSGEGHLSDFQDGSKAFFHYRVTKTDGEKTLLDDSRHASKPMELIFGKKFKMEVWERVLKTMKVKEVAEFTCETKHCAIYPVVAKSLRDIHKGKAHSHGSNHCCGMMSLANNGMGYDDLNELMKEPQPLIFTLELLSFEKPEEYEKESWSMDEKEKLASIPKLRAAGNEFYGKGNLEEASQKYAQALSMLEDLMLIEKPGSEEWTKLDVLKRGLLLNFSQCKLKQSDFYTVITHTTEVLEKEPDNIKALYRRGKAHAAVWNTKEAISDFTRATELDPSLETAVKKELAALDKRVKDKDQLEKSRLKGMFG